MDVWQLVIAMAGAWLVVSCVAALVLGRVVRRRDAEEMAGRLYSSSSMEKLEGVFAAH